jgi:RNA polymerase sigma-70 factor (ECF subfamily)
MHRLPSQRAQWLAHNIVPHERAIRAWLSRRAYELDHDDIIQEMYAKLASLPSVDDIRSPRHYALQVAFSIMANQLRRLRVVPITAVGDIETLEAFAPEASPEEQVGFRDELRDVHEALAALPHRCRQAFLLRRVEGYSQREVAQRLAISEKTVEKYMAQGVRCLIDAFGRGGKPQSAVSLQTRAGANGTRPK